MTDQYIHESDELTNFKCDPNVIINKKYLKYVTRVNYKEEICMPPLAMDWYPRCNAYYPYTENVDAINRVNHLLEAKQFLASFTTFTPDPQENFDPYTDDQSKLQYLYSKPATFLILGKPGIGEQELGKLLAEHWKCVYIDPETLIDEEIRSGSRAGQCIEFNLRCGRAVAVDVILRLVEKRVNSKSACHRGFVICGFPLIRNDMYQDDLVSSESAVFTAQEIFDEIVEPVGVDSQVLINVSQTSHLSKRSEASGDTEHEVAEVAEVAEVTEAGEEIETKSVDQKVATVAKKQSPTNFSVDIGSTTSNICRITNIGTNYGEQLNFLFSLCHEPLIIIYIMCQNTDVVNKHEQYRYDLKNQEYVNLQRDQSESIVYTIYTKNPGFDNEGGVPEDIMPGLGDHSAGFSSSDLMYLMYLPSDFSGNIACQLEQYHFEALPTIEKHVLLHNPEYFIKVDGRISPFRMFNIIKTKLRILPIPRIIVPEKLVVPPVSTGGEGDEFESFDFENKTAEECYEELSKRKIVHRMFKWQWSKWGAVCPVSMKEGIYMNGLPKFSVKFLNKIFFLSSEDAVTKFTRNPRPYLLPPCPRPTCKIIVIGPKSSGKTAVADCLSLVLNGKVLDPFKLQVVYIKRKEKEYIDRVRTVAINEGMILLAQMRQREYENKEKQRKDKITKWSAKQKLLVEERLLLGRLVEYDPNRVQMSSFPLQTMQGGRIVDPELMEKFKDKHDILKIKFVQNGLPFFDDLDLCTVLSERPANLLAYLPDELKNPTEPPEPVNVFDCFVTEYSDAAVEKASYAGIEMSLDDTLEMYSVAIKEVEEKNKAQGENHGGWIIDGISPNTELLERLFKEWKPDDIFVLDDPDKTFLLDRYRVKGRNEFRDFKNFFEKLDKPDVALISPSLTSTVSYKSRIAREVIDDILEDDLITGEMTAQEEEIPDEFVDVDYFAIHNTRFAIKQYERELNEFEKDYADVVEFFHENNIDYAEINVVGKTLEDVMKEVLNFIEHKFQISAHELTPEDRMQEMEDFGEAEIAGEGMGEEEEDEGKVDDGANSFNLNRRLGDTNNYCPVTFYKKWVLWKGKEQYAARYENKIYLMCNEPALKEFLSEPRQFVSKKPPELFPPPRICIVGVAGSGKTTLAKALRKSLGLFYISYDTLLKDSISQRSRYDLNSIINANEGSPDAEAIAGYIASDQPLPAGLLNFINLKRIWYEEPIRSCGFVLDGYPKRPSDIDYMEENVTIPDIVLELFSPDVEVNKRHIEKLINDWQEETSRQKKKQEETNKQMLEYWEEQRDARIKELREIKRQERYQAKINERSQPGSQLETVHEADESASSTDRSQVSYDSVAEQADLEEVMKIVVSELPEPVFEYNWETLEEATERFINQTEREFITDTEYNRLLKEYCDTELIEWYTLDGTMSIEKIFCQAMRVVDKIKFRNISFFERCYDVTVDMAEKLIDNGYYFLSRFGKVCPVQLYEKINPVLMLLPLEQKFQLLPVIHRSYIYFLAGKENRDKFFANPLKYTMQDNALFPLIPFKVAIIGPPKCGKTTLSERFKRDMGLKLISIGQAARYVLRFLPQSNLAKQMEIVLRNGWELTSEMTIKCVEAMAFDGKGITQGLVFDGFPNSRDDVRHLAEVGLIPHLVIDLEANICEIFECLSTDKGKRGLPVFSENFIEHRHNEWLKNASNFRQWFDKEYQILGKTNIKPSKWGVWSYSCELATAVFSEIKHYYKYCNRDVGLRLANMQVTPTEYIQRNSYFKHYCPCCLHYSNTLISGGEPPDRTGVVQFQKYYYWLCDKHIEEFIEFTENFLVPYNNRLLPEALPSEISLKEKPKECYENGDCIVCYWDNQPARVMHAGDIKFACLYCEKVYLFDTEECKKKFMIEPYKYFSKVIHFRAAKPLAQLQLHELPILGMLEQYIVHMVVKAVTNTAVTRPLLPGLGITKSALINLGLHLKIHNTNTPKEFQPIYEKAYKLFRKRRLDFINLLARIKKTINPFIHYEEPLEKLVLPSNKGSTSTILMNLSSELATSSKELVSVEENTTSITHTMVGLVNEILDKID